MPRIRSRPPASRPRRLTMAHSRLWDGVWSVSGLHRKPESFDRSVDIVGATRQTVAHRQATNVPALDSASGFRAALVGIKRHGYRGSASTVPVGRGMAEAIRSSQLKGDWSSIALEVSPPVLSVGESYPNCDSVTTPPIENWRAEMAS